MLANKYKFCLTLAHKLEKPDTITTLQDLSYGNSKPNRIQKWWKKNFDVIFDSSLQNLQFKLFLKVWFSDNKIEGKQKADWNPLYS